MTYVIRWKRGIDMKSLGKNIGDTVETVLGIVFWILIIYFTWFGNAEKIKMDILNKVGLETFSTSGEMYNVAFAFDYEDSWFRADPDVWINIDGERYRLISEGDGTLFEQKLSKGTHIVFIETKTMHINSKKQKIEVSGNDEAYYFQVKGRKVFGAEMYHIY